MIYLPPALSFAAGAMTLALIALHMVKSARKPQGAFFIIAGLLLAVEQFSLGIMQTASDPASLLTLIRPLLISSLVFPVFGLSFILIFGRRDGGESAVRYLPWIISAALITAAAGVLLPVRLFIRELHFIEGGSFWGITVTWYGKAACAYLLLANVFFLYFLENTYRVATVPDKVVLKYPMLGILTASVVNFVVMGRVLAIALVDRYYLAVHSFGIIGLCSCFLFATLRYRLFDMQVYIGRRFATSALAVIISGAYFLALALITYLARAFGFTYDKLTLIVLALFATFLLIAVLISGKAKRRLRQFINENFYINRYDYRKEWRRYAELMAHSSTIQDLVSNVVSSLCETTLARQGIVCVAANCRTKAFYGVTERQIDDETLDGLMSLLSSETVMISKKPLVSFEPEGSGSPDDPVRIHAAALLGTPRDPIGVIALADKHMNVPYSEEDRNFIETVADQATAALESLFMEEAILESRQMETFTRFASFIIHDLKNAVGMLSLTAENAKKNIGSIEFQRDAIDTIEQSVRKMHQLIDSLKAFEAPVSITKTSFDLGKLAASIVESLKPIAAARGVALEYNVESAVTVSADREAIARVIENIVLNGIEASHEGGAVTIRVETPDDERASVVVKDNGGGFDPGYMEHHLFSLFHSTKKGGLGIGLVLCKSIVDSHGGRLHIESEPDRGSTVTVQLFRAGRDARPKVR
jgi:putative PEP-CTERM system histidine kinase